MSEADASQYAGRVRILFQHANPLAPDQVEPFLREIITGLPLPPDEVEVDPDGSGFAVYGEDETLTLDDLTGVVMWLRDHPRLSDVRWQAIFDVGAG